MRQVEPDKARQGRRGYQVLMVLVGALFLVGIAWVAVSIYGEAIDPIAPTENAPGAPSPSMAKPPEAPPAN